jgi:hypothetical protein
MCCPVAAILMGFPRVALALIWLFTDRTRIAFDSFWIGALGFIFLPFTTVFWTVAYAPIGGVQGIGWALVILGFILDIASYTSGGESARRQRASYA